MYRWKKPALALLIVVACQMLLFTSWWANRDTFTITRAETAPLPTVAWKRCFVHTAFAQRVIDGDTYEARVLLDAEVVRIVRVRLPRIQAPERGQPGFAESTKALRDLLGTSELRLRTCETDLYGRWLSETMVVSGTAVAPPPLTGGVNVSDWMMEQKHAVPSPFK